MRSSLGFTPRRRLIHRCCCDPVYVSGIADLRQHGRVARVAELEGVGGGGVRVAVGIDGTARWLDVQHARLCDGERLRDERHVLAGAEETSEISGAARGERRSELPLGTLRTLRATGSLQTVRAL